jgi:hypothetical protein
MPDVATNRPLPLLHRRPRHVRSGAVLAISLAYFASGRLPTVFATLPRWDSYPDRTNSTLQNSLLLGFIDP